MKILMIHTLLLAALGMPSLADDSPEGVFQRFVAEASAGRTNEALACCIVNSESTRKSGAAQIQEMATGKLTFEVVRSVTNGPVALVAALAIRTNDTPPSCSGTWARLVRDEETWRIISNLIGAPKEKREAFQRLLRTIEPFEPELRQLSRSREEQMRKAWLSTRMQQKLDNQNPNKPSEATP